MLAGIGGGDEPSELVARDRDGETDAQRAWSLARFAVGSAQYGPHTARETKPFVVPDGQAGPLPLTQ
jgi:hypothetical protein